MERERERDAERERRRDIERDWGGGGHTADCLSELTTVNFIMPIPIPPNRHQGVGCVDWEIGAGALFPFVS